MSSGTGSTDEPAEVQATVRDRIREGATLYNAGEHWEAHEAWEEAWHALRDADDGRLAELVQGLILATAAFENLRRGKPRGFATQGAKALSRLRRHAGEGARLGLVDERAFYEGLLDVYLLVQREKIETLSDDRVTAPWLEVDAEG